MMKKATKGRSKMMAGGKTTKGRSKMAKGGKPMAKDPKTGKMMPTTLWTARVRWRQGVRPPKAKPK